MEMQCSGKKNDGSRCTRKNEVSDDVEEWYCWQHQSRQNLTNDNGYKLTKNQLNAIDMLVSGQLTKTEIANECNIARQTLYEWLDDERFKEEYQKRLQEIREKFSPKLTQVINETLEYMEPAMIHDEKDRANYLEKLVKIQQLINGEATNIVKSEVEHSGEIDTNQQVNIVNQIANDKELRDNLERIHRKRQQLLEDATESK